MAWGADTSLGTALTTVDNTTEEFIPPTGGISLNPRESAHIQLTIDNESGSVTDALECRVYTTLDDTTEEWDETPFMAFTVEPGGIAAEQYSFMLAGCYKFRLGFLSAGATDLYSVSGQYRKDGVSA